jgi:dienelactone hydrolase
MRAATVPFVLAALAAAASADTVVLKGGKKLEGVVCEERKADDAPVVVNPYNSRCPEMTYGITDKDRYPADKVDHVDTSETSIVAEYRIRASKLEMTAADHLELAKFCETHKLAEERDRELKLTLCADPANAEALAAVGKTPWATWSKGNPLADENLRTLEKEYVGLEKPAELAAQWDQMTAKGTTRARAYLERARRSRKFPLGRRDKVPLTVRSELAVGANYCIYLPKNYDPLVPTGLVVGLHGGGKGSPTDPTLVTGNGQEAMNFYTDVAEERGVIVVCPSALAAPWGDKKNEPFLDALIDEMKMLYNIDENRIWLTGHSMGGFGTWYWGPKRADVWAAFAPCAGGGGSPADIKAAPIYIYHGTDDGVVGVGPDRAVAKSLLDDKNKPDFVYTEVDHIGHGFPDWVRHDIFRFFAGRWKDDGKKRAVWPRSSFDKKATKDEIKCFGDPAATTAAAPADAKIADLVAELEKGGGRGVEAATELAKHKDAATVAAVAHVLHSKKASTDSRVLAAKTIGEIGLADGVKQLAAEASCDDWRVLDAVVASLGKIAAKDKESVEALVRAGKQFGAFWDKANAGGQFDFTEYEIRCTSFAGLCDAFAAVGDAAAFLPVIDKEIVARVYVPKTPYTVPIDERFVEIPPRARLTLVSALHKCLVALKDPRGKALLASIKAAWSKEPRLVAEADAGINEIG